MRTILILACLLVAACSSTGRAQWSPDFVSGTASSLPSDQPLPAYSPWLLRHTEIGELPSTAQD